MVKCYSCHSELQFSANEKIHRNDDCHSCGRDLRCCKMCKFYDVNAYNECKEPVADRITEKEKANFCDYFVLGSPDGKDNSQDLLDAANSLFKK